MAFSLSLATKSSFGVCRVRHAFLPCIRAETVKRWKFSAIFRPLIFFSFSINLQSCHTFLYGVCLDVFLFAPLPLMALQMTGWSGGKTPLFLFLLRFQACSVTLTSGGFFVLYVRGTWLCCRVQGRYGFSETPSKTFCVRVLLLLFCLAYRCFRSDESPACCLCSFFRLSGVKFAWVSTEESFTRASGPKQSRRGKIFSKFFVI